MRPIALAWSFVLATNLAAQAPVTLIDNAIKAMSDSEERLAKARYMTQTGKATFALPGVNCTVTREASYAFPDRLHYTGEMLFAGQPKKPFVYVLTGFKGWTNDDGTRRDMLPGQYNSFREEMNFAFATSLMPLKAKSTKLSLVEPIKLADNTMAAGVRAELSSTVPPVNLYFEPAGKLVKASYRGTEAGVPVMKEYTFGGYKSFDGILKPTKVTVTQNDRKTEDWTFENYRFPATLPDALFNKP